MQYDISVRIDYRYDHPANSSRHIVRLMPSAEDKHQRLIVGSLSLSPQPDERLERSDFFGNRIAEVAFFKPHDSIRFSLSCRVEKTEPPDNVVEPPDLMALAREIAQNSSLDGRSPRHYTGPSRRVSLHEDVTVYGLSHAGPGMTTRDIVGSVGQAIFADMAYDPKATSVETPLLTAFRGRHGVCQDFAHIMIAALRGIGIPAGYVSGVLRTTPPPGKPRLEGADAMHAWVMAWCGATLGWVEYDPTNAVFAGENHVAIARGRDYFDVSPVRGVMRSHGTHKSKQSVDVVPVTP